LSYAHAGPYFSRSSDEALWAAVQEGDEVAFEAFVTRHRPLAMRIARRVCGPYAEDAVQAAFLAAWRSRMAFNPARGSPKAWMMTVVRNRAVDVVRSVKGRLERLEADAPDQAEDCATPDVLVEQRETARNLRAALADLPEPQRQVLTLGYFSELSQSEIAGTLGLPLGTVKGRTRLGLEKLEKVAL
jgi:RNA polymerase sigma-70 factor, ECF subfamily